MKLLITALALALFIAGAPAAAEAAPGKMTGGVKYNMPAWFKIDLNHTTTYEVNRLNYTLC